MQESFGNEQLICSALEGKHCGISSIIILNVNPFKLVHNVLLIMNTYDVRIVALVLDPGNTSNIFNN